MKILTRLILIGGLMTVGLRVPAQESGEVEQLRRQLQEMKENLERVQKQQREQIEALQKQLDAMQHQQVADADKKNLEGELARELGVPIPTPGAGVVPGKSWQPTNPIRIGKGGAYADLGMVATFAVGGSTASDIEGGTQLGGHDPNQRGFTVQGAELNLQGAVDPYFRGNANIAFQIDSGGESFVELEEAWLESVALPGNLQIRAGQLLTDFGRINSQHPHSWGFVDEPLVNGRFLGPDGLRNPGARLSWLMPLPFFSDLSLSVQNSQGGTAASFRGGFEGAAATPFAYRLLGNDRGVRGAGDMLFAPRWATSFDLSDMQTLLGGVSAAFGPNSSGDQGDTQTQVYGMDLMWKWKSSHHHAGFPFVSVQTEAMLRRYDAGAFDWSTVGAGQPMVLEPDGVTPAALAGETLTDWGLYSQVLWGFKPGWVAGLRADYVTGDRAKYESAGLIWQDASGAQTPLGRDPFRNERWRLSPNLTWYPSEFSKIRLQYNYDDRQDIGVDHSVWLQFEFLLGAHAAHKF